MDKIRIKFTDFWTDDLNNIFLYKILTEHFQVELSDEPDVLIYSVFGHEHLNYKCKKIYFTSENTIPDYNLCDYSIGFNYDDKNDRHIRYPLYLFYNDINKLIRSKVFTQEDIKHKDKFCLFVVSNPKAKERIEFFTKLNNIKRVDSAGAVLNNMPNGWRIPNGEKYSFLETYKFNIAFENSSTVGYTTEKIFEPLVCNTIPIYWGDPQVTKDFNPESFINVHDYASQEDVINRIIEVDNNPDLYLKMLNAPRLYNNVVPEHLKPERLIEFLERALMSDIKPVSQTTPFQFHKMKVRASMLRSRIQGAIKHRIG